MELYRVAKLTLETRIHIVSAVTWWAWGVAVGLTEKLTSNNLLLFLLPDGLWLSPQCINHVLTYFYSPFERLFFQALM